MGAAVPIVSEKDVTAAWNAYAAEAARIVDEPSLCLDRAFMSELTAKEARFKRLYLTGLAQ